MRKNRIFPTVLLISTLVSGCVSPQNTEVLPEETEKEMVTVRMADHPNGHVLTAIAEAKGYFADEGITIEYVKVQNDLEVFEGIQNGTIDIAANSGTNLPLQYISEGMDLTIFGGYLLTGCMPVFGRADAEWTGIEDMIGKTVACEPNLYAITGPLLESGYDPLKDIHWYETTNQEERIAAVESGAADFGLVGTGLNYDVIENPNIKILTYAADVLPAYSCCRAEALSSWVNENPETVKGMIKAWIRALVYYETHHDEAVTLMAGQVGQDEEHVRAFMDNPRFEVNIDPMKKSVKRAWSYMKRMGLLDAQGIRININEHINTDLYKAALDECQKQYGEENPAFYERMQAQYARNN